MSKVKYPRRIVRQAGIYRRDLKQYAKGLTQIKGHNYQYEEDIYQITKLLRNTQYNNIIFINP